MTKIHKSLTTNLILEAVQVGLVSSGVVGLASFGVVGLLYSAVVGLVSARMVGLAFFRMVGLVSSRVVGLMFSGIALVSLRRVLTSSTTIDLEKEKSMMTALPKWIFYNYKRLKLN